MATTPPIAQPINIIDTTSNIKKIIHLADIHIRKLRQEEYRHVFATTYKKIKELINCDQNTSIIYIAGDIIDSKNNLSPSLVDLTREFLVNLATICPIHLIIGNHDCAISNESEIDSISCLLPNLDTKYKIHLLKDNTFYLYGNLLIGVTNIYANSITKVTDKLKIKYKDKIRIAYYHGPIQGSKTCTNYKLDNTMFGIKEFKKNYHWGLFGDIHKQQFLTKDKKFLYVGSLIEQNISEIGEDNPHGFFCHDLTDNKSTYTHIPNEYRFIKLKVIDGKIKKYNKDNFPKFGKVRIMYKNTPQSTLDKKVRKIRTTYPDISEIICVPIVDNNFDITYDFPQSSLSDSPLCNSGPDPDPPDKKLSEIKDYHSIEKLIKNYIEKREIDMDQLKSQKILDLIREMLKEINFEYQDDKRYIELKSLEFDNLFSYGSNNKINFSDFGSNKIIGICGNNGHGKSAIIDSLLYSIYGKFSRGTEYDVINREQDNCRSKITLSVNNEEYKIEREIKREGKKFSSRLNFHHQDKLITNDRKMTTCNDIINTICPYDSIVDNNIVTQSCRNNFLDMHDTEKRDHIYNILNLNIFNEIIKKTNSNKCIYTKMISIFEKKTLDYDIKKINSEILNLRHIIETKTDEYDSIKKQKDNNNKSCEELCLTFGATNNDVSAEELCKIISYVKKTKLSISRTEKEIRELGNKEDKLMTTISNYENKLTKYTSANIEENYKKFRLEQQTKIKQLNDERDILMKSLIVLNKNTTINKIEKIVKNLENQLRELENSIDNNNKEIKKLRKENDTGQKKIKDTSKLEEQKKKYEEYLCNKKIIEDYDKKIAEELENKQRYQKSLDKIKDHQYDPNCEYCIKNDLTKQQTYLIEEISLTDNNIEKYQQSKKKINLKQNTNIEKKYETTKKNVLTNEKIGTKYENNIHKIELLEKDINLTKNKIDGVKKEVKVQEEFREQYNKNKITEKQINDIDIKIEEENSKKYQKYEEYNIIKNKYSRDKEQLLVLRKSINDKEKFLNSTEKTMIENNYNTIDENTIDLIKELKEKNNQFDKKLSISSEELSNLKKSLAEREYELKKESDATKEIGEYKDILESYNDISHIIEKSNGLVEYIMNEIVLPKIQSKVNDILSYLTNFKITMEYRNKRIVVDTISNKTVTKAATLSGYEKFAVNIAFRIILNQINKKVGADFIILDEPFLSCDADNLIKLRALFDFIREKYKWCIIITHLDNIKDNFDKVLYIKKENNISAIYK